MLNIDTKLQNKNTYINQEPLVKQLTHIYSYNESYIKNTKPTFTYEQNQILKYFKENISDGKNNTSVCATNMQQRWIYAIYEIADVKEVREFASIEKKFDISSWLTSNKQYYLYLNNGENIELNNNDNSYNILYSNIGGAILEKVN